MKNKSFFHKSEYEELYFLKENDRLIKKIHDEQKSTSDLSNVVQLFPEKESKPIKDKKSA
ncbi:MAG: hypothetical protein M9899_02240 [Bdellovibrionaceae bacterium]|nr:hypothetical protein [Pseudobdellovibrionaceae bacterium]